MLIIGFPLPASRSITARACVHVYALRVLGSKLGWGSRVCVLAVHVAY